LTRDRSKFLADSVGASGGGVGGAGPGGVGAADDLQDEEVHADGKGRGDDEGADKRGPEDVEGL